MNSENEMHKNLIGFPGYTISNYGKIINTATGYVLKPIINKDGYYSIVLRSNGKKINSRIHKLVAKVFIPNPKNNPVINHIDGNKLNNYYKNIEWTTVKRNTIHAYELELNSLTIRVSVIDNIDNNYLAYFHLYDL
jgi:hypothetical protein